MNQSYILITEANYDCIGTMLTQLKCLHSTVVFIVGGMNNREYVSQLELLLY